MTDLKNNIARMTLIAMLSVSPAALFADTESGSPAQSVDADPDEMVDDAAAAGCSMEDSDAKSDGTGEGCDMADVDASGGDDDGDGSSDADGEGSLVDEDAKSDG